MGGEAQSTAFFKPPGIERSHSGETNKMPSEVAIASFSARAEGG